MTRTEQQERLIGMLLAESPQNQALAASLPSGDAARRRLLRSLMNVRPPRPLDRSFLQLQDMFLSAERE